MKNSTEGSGSSRLLMRITAMLLAAALLFNASADSFAQAYNLKRQADQKYSVLAATSWQYDAAKSITAVQESTRVVIPGVQLAQLKSKEIDAAAKIQAAYAKKAAQEQKTVSDLKKQYKYNEYDKTAYREKGQWLKRKDGSEKNTGFYGEIVLQAGPNRGKVITEATVMLQGKDGKEVEVPLLNPYLKYQDLPILRNGNINEGMIKQASLWLAQCERERRTPFAQEAEVAQYSKWRYKDLDNFLQLSLVEIQAKAERKKEIRAKIEAGLSNPYFFGELSDEWKAVEAEIKKEARDNKMQAAVLASNNLLNKTDAKKQVQIINDEYEKNEKNIEREVAQRLRDKIQKSQQAEQINRMLYNDKIYKQIDMAPEGLKDYYRAQLIMPDLSGRSNKYIGVGDAVAFGLISKEDVNNIQQSVTQEYIGQNVAARFEKYIKEESGHNIRNLSLGKQIGEKTNYFFTNIQNNSIIGKLSLGLIAGVEGLVTWTDPSKIYQRDFQRNQNYLNYYNMGTDWTFVQEVALTTGAFASDAGVFKALGMASAALLPELTTASSAAAQIILPSAQTGLVLGSYEGLNSFGNTLGYKNLGDFKGTDWGRIGYDTGRGLTTGAIVGQYGKLIWGGQSLGPKLIPAAPSAAISNGVRNMALGMSEGAVFSVSGTAYDQGMGMVLPQQGDANYVGGNRNAFAQMTPEGMVKDMVKFYFAIKLPGNAIYSGTQGPAPKAAKQTLPARPVLQEQASRISEAKGKQWAEADLQNAKAASLNRGAKPAQWLLEDVKGNYQAFRPQGGKPGALQPLEMSESAQSQNSKNLTASVGAANGGGVNSNRVMTPAERVAWEARVARETAEAQVRYDAEIAEFNAETSAALAKGSAFKGNFIINKPYSELSPSRKWIANQWVNAQYNFARFGEVISAMRASPQTAVMALSVPVGTTGVMLTPAAVYAPAPAQTTFAKGVVSTNTNIAAKTSSYSTTADLAVKGNVSATQSAPAARTVTLPPFAAVRDGWDLGGGGGATAKGLSVRAGVSARARETEKAAVSTAEEEAQGGVIEAKDIFTPVSPASLTQAAQSLVFVGNSTDVNKGASSLTDVAQPLVFVGNSANLDYKFTIGEQNFLTNVNLGQGLYGSTYKAPKGSDKKRGVEAFYLDEQGNEVKLPITFNIDKGIKITNKQRIVFNSDNKLEIRNGTKKPQLIEGFAMLLENTPEARVNFLSTVYGAGLQNPLDLKLQVGSRGSRHFKPVALSAEGLQTSPINLSIGSGFLKKGENLVLNNQGIFETEANGVTSVLNDATFRVPKKEIGSFVDVLKTAQTPLVFDIVPTQKKLSTFVINFLMATSTMAFAPAFEQVFQLGDFWTNLIMGFAAFGPAITIPFFGHFFKKYGVRNVMKFASIIALGGTLLSIASGFYGYASPAASILPVIGGTLGLTTLSFANEIKFTSLSPLVEANFDSEKKRMSATNKTLIGRALGTVAYLYMAPAINMLLGKLGLPLANDSIAFITLLLPLAGLGILKMYSSRLRDVPDMAENDIAPKALWNLFFNNKDIRKGALALTLFESFEATMSLLVFSLAKSHFGELSSVPNFAGGAAIYLAMVLGRLVAAKLQDKGIWDAKKTYTVCATLSILGTALFIAGGGSLMGLAGAATAFAGISMNFAPLYNVTSARNPGKSSEISILFFAGTVLAAFSTGIMGLVQSLIGSQMAGFVIPAACLLGAFYLSKHVFGGLFDNIKAKLGNTQTEEGENGPDMNNPQPQN